MPKDHHELTVHVAVNPPSKDTKSLSSHGGTIRQRRAVPPGYLHDLFHTRHLMKSVGLRRSIGPSSDSYKQPNGPSAAATASSTLPVVAVTGARLIPAPRTRFKARRDGGDVLLPTVLEERKRYLQKKRSRERDKTPYACTEPGQPLGLLSLPEDVLLRIVCKLQHDDIKPLFLVCRRLSRTLQDAVRFHFNYATPCRQNEVDGPTPEAKRARRQERRRNITAFADVLAHLRKGQRGVSGAMRREEHQQHAPMGSTGPRVLRFTPASTPIGGGQETPMSRLRTTPGASKASPLSSGPKGLRFGSIGLTPTSIETSNEDKNVAIGR